MTDYTPNVKEIAEVLASTFEEIANEDNYDAEFICYKRTAEQRVQSFESHNEEPYNMPITMQELVHAIQTNKIQLRVQMAYITR